MHVSPFCPVEGHYQFQFRDTAFTSQVSLDYYDQEGLLIKTSVGGRVQDLTPLGMLRATLTQPWLTAGIVAGIHWQALRLWIKGARFYSKPTPPTIGLTKSRINNEEQAS
jgi:DUF1365 family protein